MCQCVSIEKQQAELLAHVGLLFLLLKNQFLVLKNPLLYVINYYIKIIYCTRQTELIRSNGPKTKIFGTF